MLQPTIRVRGVVGGRQIIKSFAPSLPFTFSAAVLALNAPAPTTLPGASYDPPTTATTNETALQPVLSGSLPVRAPNSVSLVKLSLAVSMLRGLGLGLVGLALLGICTKPLRKKRETWSHEKRIAFRVGCVIVDVVSLESAVASTGVPTALPDFESLAHFARYLERPILRDAARRNATPSRTAGACTSSARRDAAETAPKPVASFEHAPRVKASASGPRPARRRRTIVGAVGLLFAATVAVGLVTSFTAASTVPMSRAGVTKWTLTPPQLTPAYCSSLVASKLVVATSATVTGTTANDLVLGRNATGTQTHQRRGGRRLHHRRRQHVEHVERDRRWRRHRHLHRRSGHGDDVRELRVHRHALDGERGDVLELDGRRRHRADRHPHVRGSRARPPRSASFETPVDRGDNLGSRLQAYLTVPATGSYTFWMASDDNGRLFLSTNADPANRVAIASVAGYTASEAWDTFPSQQSSPIALVAGRGTTSRPGRRRPAVETTSRSPGAARPSPAR